MPEDIDIPSRPTGDSRPDITMPDGTKRTPRARLAKKIGIAERTLARKNTPTTYIGGVAYVDPDVATVAVVGEPLRRNQLPRRRARSGAAS